MSSAAAAGQYSLGRERVELTRTVGSTDGATIDCDAYGAGPTVILIGGTTQHRAIDHGRRRLPSPRNASRRSTTTDAVATGPTTRRLEDISAPNRESTIALTPPRSGSLDRMGTRSESSRSRWLCNSPATRSWT